tara:strand:+ start:357 stop:644 length:288 start_codon:yes stop_codon:yes gene_type:complete
MGGRQSKISPFNASHGNYAVFHQQLVREALTRRQEMLDMANTRRSQSELDIAAENARREVAASDPERIRQYRERTKMMKEDKPQNRGGRGRGRRD